MKYADWFIDADTHVTEPGDVWTERLPKKFQDAAPRMIRTDDGVDIWRFGTSDRPIPVGATVFYSLSNKMDFGFSIATDLKNEPADNLSFGFKFFYNGGAIK